ncbi:hypothetical protein TrRE_jg9742 [Triparma retinervis]|uniref:Uncharacterized protein n=1 Tax=Triparma retinervis TaxID=2557542 RepID=A0A9W7CBV7_9STRA|nr:hypothetical protein TrRE_jg9742 [Triparma retinervis]
MSAEMSAAEMSAAEMSAAEMSAAEMSAALDRKDDLFKTSLHPSTSNPSFHYPAGRMVTSLSLSAYSISKSGGRYRICSTLPVPGYGVRTSVNVAIDLLRSQGVPVFVVDVRGGIRRSRYVDTARGGGYTNPDVAWACVEDYWREHGEKGGWLEEEVMKERDDGSNPDYKVPKGMDVAEVFDRWRSGGGEIGWRSAMEDGEFMGYVGRTRDGNLGIFGGGDTDGYDIEEGDDTVEGEDKSVRGEGGEAMERDVGGEVDEAIMRIMAETGAK